MITLFLRIVVVLCLLQFGCTKMTNSEQNLERPEVHQSSTSPEVRASDSATMRKSYSLLGLSTSLNKDALNKQLEILANAGYRVHLVDKAKVPDTIDGVSTEGLSHRAFEISSADGKKKLLVGYLEHDGSAGFLCSVESSKVSVELNGDAVFSTGNSIDDLRMRFSNVAGDQSDNPVLTKIPDGWLAVKFIEGVAYSLTLIDSRYSPAK